MALCLIASTFVAAAVDPASAASRGREIPGRGSVRPFEARIPRRDRVSTWALRRGGPATDGVTPFAAAPAPTITFPGLGRQSLGSAWPPGTAGDVGPDVYIEAVNSGFGVFRKSDGSQQAATTFASLFGAANTGTVCDTASSSDPAVLYDTQSDRWIVAIMAWGDILTGPYDECIAVSTTGDPVSSPWRLYPVQLESAGTHAKDLQSPRLGMWLDGVYMAADVFDDVSGGLGAQVFAFNRADLEAGTTLRWQATTSNPVGTTLDGDEALGLVPANLHTQAASPAAGTNELFLGNSQSGNNIDIWRYHVDWTTPANTWIGKNASTTAPATVAYTAYPATPDDVVEPSPGNPLYPQDDDTLAAVQYGVDNSGGNQRQVVWTGFIVGQGTNQAPEPRASIKWLQIRVDQTNPSGRQEGTWGPDQASRWAPGMAADKLGDLALGYSITSSAANSTAGNLFPSIRYAGRLVGDSLNQLPQTEQALFTGTGYQCCSYEDSTVNDDWGPYSAMSLDPDGCTFWLANEYYDTAPTTLAQDDWKTRIGAFRYAGCTPSTLATSIGSVSGTGGFGGTGTLVATLSSTSTGNSGVSGKTISFKLNGTSVGTAVTNASGVAALTGVSMAGIARGTYPGSASASFAGSTAYGASGPATGSLTVGKGPQTITFAPIPDHNLGDPDFALTATASSGLTVSYMASGVCNLVGGITLHLSAVGQCTMTTSQAGNADYDPAPNVVRTFSVNGTAQTITFPQPPNHTFGDADFTVSATASSGLPVTIAAAGVCTISGMTVHITGAGTCSLSASQAGNGTFGPAPDVVRTLTVNKGSQTITFPDPGNQTVGVPLTSPATASSGVAVTYVGDANCSVSGSTVTPLHVGTCVVTAQQAGNANWNAAADVVRTIQIPNKGNQTISFPDPGNQTVTVPFVPATTSSGLTVTLTPNDGNCQVSGTSVTPVHVGICSITASQAGNADWNAAADITRAVQVTGKGSQTITAFTTANSGSGSNRAVGEVVSLSLTATSGLGVLYTTTTPGTCTTGATTVTFTALGTCTIVADQPGNADWSAAPQVGPKSYAILQKGNQNITFPAPGSKVFGADFAVAATASSGLPVTIISSTPSVCTVSGTTVHPVAAGTCGLTASQAGDANWNAAVSITRNVTISKGDQTITFPAIPDHTFGDPDFTVSATTTSGLAATFTASGQCSVTGSTVHLTAPGFCTITAHQAGSANWNAAPDVARTFTINSLAKVDQTIVFPAISDHTYGDADFTVSAVASSGLPVSYAAAGPCTISGNTVHLTGAGSCTITASQTGNAVYNPAPDVPRTFNIAKANQTITFASIPNHTYGDPDFTVNATASSGLAVSFSATGPCAVSGSTVHFTGAGSCTITASQAGNANDNAAPDVSQTFSITKSDQSITFNALSDRSYGDADLTVSATASSGLAVSFAASGACAVSGSTVHLTGAGSCTITASQAGNANYNAAPVVSRSFTIAKGNQTITFGALPDRTFDDADFGVSASASSGLPVSFAASGACSLNGSTVHLTGAGSCTVTASQGGNGNYNAAPDLARSFNIAKANQTISFGTIPGHTFGDSDFGVTATASSGLSVTFTASGSCTVSGATVHLTGTGSCTVTAHQGGNANYNAATDVQQSFSIAKASQTITFPSIPNHGTSDPDFTVSATASSGLTVGFTAAGSCTVTGATVHLTGAGSCTITAHQPGDANTSAAPDVPRTFSITSNATSTTTKLALSRTSVAQGGSVKFTATVTVASGPKPTGTARFLVDGVSVGSGNLNGKGKLILTLTISQAKGTHPVQAVYDGNTSFAGSTSASKNLKVT